MSNLKNTVVDLTLAITGNVSAQSLARRKGGGTSYGSGLDAGGRIDLGTATTAVVTITDSLGVVLHSGTVTTDTTVAPTAQGLQGPILVTVASISNSAHTLTVSWKIKK